MHKVVKYSGSFNKTYCEDSLLTKVKDRFSFNYNGEIYVENLDLIIKEYKISSNLHKDAYKRNSERVIKKNKDYCLSPQFYRMYDYNYYTELQKKVLAFSVTESVSTILRLQKKKLNEACIIINNAELEINKSIIYQLAQRCRYLILCFPKYNTKGEKIYEDLINRFGISTIIINDVLKSANKADFIITCSPLLNNITTPIWYLDNSISPQIYNNIAINNISYKSQWANINTLEPEMLGVLLKLLKGDNIEEVLDSNKIYIEAIKFNDYTIKL
ncbi:hypothetical protein [Clostridium grantii]|uniref:Uncharacterized protein n=1 Tax=Clostridium grantii DSM 8605 TaxID=1121316 RepID=A0A1M5XXX8_9CLOT|nr:hypothetical protein [Clostridium grantii]SHI04691.1 hypothetical protein SAMN02745207_04023 [Clostridium grantii DSM 8605]